MCCVCLWCLCFVLVMLGFSVVVLVCLSLLLSWFVLVTVVCLLRCLFVVMFYFVVCYCCKLLRVLRLIAGYGLLCVCFWLGRGDLVWVVFVVGWAVLVACLVSGLITFGLAYVLVVWFLAFRFVWRWF